MGLKKKRPMPLTPESDNPKLVSRLRRIYAPVAAKPDAFGRRRASPREIDQVLARIPWGEAR